MARTLDQTQALDRFLAAVERRAFRMACVATRSEDDALDLVQEAMLKLVQHYSDRDETQWGPLFQRILQSKIRDWYRRTTVRNRWRTWLRWGADESRETDPLDAVPDVSMPAVDDQVAHTGARPARWKTPCARCRCGNSKCFFCGSGKNMTWRKPRA